MRITLLIALLLSSFTSAVFAQTIQVNPNDNLQAALDAAEDGDTLILAPGEYLGNFVINRSIHITATTPHTAVINAGGTGHGLLLKNSHIHIENLSITHWGHNLTTQDSGIYSDQGANNLTIRNNLISGDGFGIWLQKGQKIKVFHNVVRGNPQLRSSDRGNGIQLSIVQDTEVAFNDVSQTRDGIYIISSQNNIIRDNTMHALRYGVHYMYSHSNQVLNNYAYDIRAGYALMSSRTLVVSGNRSENSEDYGFLMNFITSSTITDNIIKQVWTKPEHKALGREGKGLFVYNSGYNTISYNTVDTAEIGIHLTAGSENTQVYGNNFINNPVQVKYVSNSEQEWSLNEAGNYWSNYLGWDLDNNGKGDNPFEPNDGIDKIVWQYPEAKVLLDSPAILILRWVQQQFPILKPAGVRDSFPLMQPRVLTAPQTTQVEPIPRQDNL